MKYFLRDSVLTVLLAVLALLTLSATGWLAFLPQGGSTPPATYEADPIIHRDLIDYNGASDSRGFVAYRYYGDKLPEKLAPDEVIQKRTGNSWSRITGYKNKGTPQEEVIVSAVVYPQETFIQKDGAWYYVEHGVTKDTFFDRYKKEHELSLFFIPVAHATTATVFSAAGDGYVENTDTATSTTLIVFNTVQASTTGTNNQYTTATAQIGVYDISLKGETLAIDRGFFPFDTSSIPANATISAASLNVYGTTTSQTQTNDAGGLDYITVVRTSQTTHTSLAKSDYNKDGSPNTNPTEGIDSGQRKDISSLGWAIDNGSGQSALNTFTLNATGIGWIALSGQSSNCSATAGISCFGLREGNDATRTLGSMAANKNMYVLAVTSENTGTSIDPYLSITYTAPTFAFFQFQDF